LQRVYVTTRDNAAHALCVTVASDVNTRYLTAARANIVPPFPCRLHPRQGNERIVARRRELAQDAAIPHRRVFPPLGPAFLHPLPSHKARNYLPPLTDVGRVKCGNGVRHNLRVGKIRVEDRTRFQWVPNMEYARPFGSHQRRMDALVNRGVNLCRLVHDYQDAARLGVDTLDRAWIVGRKPKDKPPRPKTYFGLQKLRAQRDS